MKNLKYLYIFFALIVISQKNVAQTITANSTNGAVAIEKTTPVTTSIQTEQIFSYTIRFQNLDSNAAGFDIWDILPSNIVFVSAFANPDFKNHNSAIVPFGSLGGNINPSSLPTIEFNNLQNYMGGSFVINVKFPGGVTPNGISITNNICGNYDYGLGTTPEQICTTGGVTSTSSAINPWGTITKEPLYPAIEDANGDFYIPRVNGKANYRIVVEKKPQYRNQQFGMLNLTNVDISESFMSCATITILSGPGTYNNTTNSIDLSNDLRGHIPGERVEFIVEVDYSGCTLTNGQVIPNIVKLNGTPIGENPLLNIAQDSAKVIAIDTIIPPLGKQKLFKTVQVSNQVAGCLGEYTITYVNTDNRPISFIDISDTLPNDISPQSISISGSSNTAALTNSYTLTINNGAPSTITIPPGHSNSNPSIWGTSNNSFSLIANTTTTLEPYEYITIRIPFIINGGLSIGTIVNNCAIATASIIDPISNINEVFNEQSCASFKIKEPEVKLCLKKQVRKANTNNAFTSNITNIIPTDELEFQICFQNNGSLDFQGQLTDVLDSKYEFVSVVSDNFPTGTTFIPPTAANGQTLTWNNIIAPQSCSNFSYSGCWGSGSTTYCTIIKVKVKPYTLPGNIDNISTIDGNIPNPLSSTAKVNIIESSVVKLEKEISENLISFSQSLTIDPTVTSSVFYRLKITNLGNIPVLNHQIIDEMPSNGDVWYPATGWSRNSTFSLDNFADTSSPNYNTTFSNSTPRTSSCIPQGNTSSSISTKSIIYNSNSPALNPGDSNTMIIKADVPSGLSSGDKACNSAYFLNCSTQSGIVIPSNIVCLNIYIPPCTSCEDDGNFEAYTQSNSLTTIPETGVHSEINGIPVFTENYTLKTDWNWVTKVRILVSEFEPIIAENCESCNYNMEQTGNLVYNMFPNQLGNLTKESIQYQGVNQNFVREIVYSGLPDTSFLAGVTTNLALAIPDLNALECCPSDYKVCLKFIFEGPNCENCEVEYCTVLEEGMGPIFGPEPCPEIGVDAWEFISSYHNPRNCCEKVLAFKAIGCDTQSTFKVRNSNNVIVVQGTVTNPTMSVPITENGTYTVEINCLCADGTPNIAISNPVTITGILAPLPSGQSYISNATTNSLSAGVGYVNVNFSNTVIGQNYGYKIEVQQEIQDGMWRMSYPPNGQPATQGTYWKTIETVEKQTCSLKSIEPIGINYNYGMGTFFKPSNGPFSLRIRHTYTTNFRLLISWTDCSGTSQQYSYLLP